jgi:putative spermidine/putrescine transport system substrate-binding protein
MDHEFQKDRAEILGEAFRAGSIDRRRFLTYSAMLGLSTAAFKSSGALAQSNEVVLANWGGDAVPASHKAYGEPLQKSGLKLVIDTTGPTPGKIKAMVDSRAVRWDVIDTAVGASHYLGADGLLEEVDYSIVDKSLDMPGLGHKYGVGAYTFSVVLVYDQKAFGDKKPTGWKDFWDLKNFPGKRMLRRDPQGVLEAALMADGVAMDKIYPIDLARAFKKIDEIKKNCVFWNSGSESQQIMRSGEATMGLIWNTRAQLLGRETNGQIASIWNEGILQPSTWTVPKGAPAGKNAFRLIRVMQEPGPQIEILRLLGNGPVNAQASANLPAELKRLNPSDPEHIKVQLPYGVDWYIKNYTEVLPKYLDFIAS